MLIFLFPLLAIISYNPTTLAADHPYLHCYSISDTSYFASRNEQLHSLPYDVNTSGGVVRYGEEPYCLGLCRKDLISSDACYTCINTTASAIIRSCPAHNAFVAWGADAGCIVQCDPPNLDSDTTRPLNYSCNTTSISKNYLTQFHHTLANLTSTLAVKAGQAGSQSSFPYGFQYIQYFATEEVKFSDLQTIYAAAICNPSISNSDCTTCCSITSGFSLFSKKFVCCLSHYA